MFNAKLLEDSFGAREETLGDKTGLESYVNHIHIGDYLKAPADALVQGVLYVERIAAAWRACGETGTHRRLVGGQ